jgi:hypothetical protein
MLASQRAFDQGNEDVNETDPPIDARYHNQGGNRRVMHPGDSRVAQPLPTVQKKAVAEPLLSLDGEDRRRWVLTDNQTNITKGDVLTDVRPVSGVHRGGCA